MPRKAKAPAAVKPRYVSDSAKAVRRIVTRTRWFELRRRVTSKRSNRTFTTGSPEAKFR